VHLAGFITKKMCFFHPVPRIITFHWKRCLRAPQLHCPP